MYKYVKKSINAVSSEPSSRLSLAEINKSPILNIITCTTQMRIILLGSLISRWKLYRRTYNTRVAMNITRKNKPNARDALRSVIRRNTRIAKEITVHNGSFLAFLLGMNSLLWIVS